MHHLSFIPPLFSKKSLASFTLVAKYDEPPLSGWLAIMSFLWCSFNLAFDNVLSFKFKICKASDALILAPNVPLTKAFPFKFG